MCIPAHDEQVVLREARLYAYAQMLRSRTSPSTTILLGVGGVPIAHVAYGVNASTAD